MEPHHAVEQIRTDLIAEDHRTMPLLGSNPRAMVERIRGRHPAVPILVHGDAEQVETIAAILAAGASGYFLLSAPQTQLLEALRVVRDGNLWAPQMAVALMAH
jgi:DNA-binding NarL/FixJ family response regulator